MTQFKKQWNKADFAAAESAIKKHFNKVGIVTDHNGKRHNLEAATYKYINLLIGLAYTSSSSYAGLWVCNLDIDSTIPAYHYIGFAIAENNDVYAVCWDKNENEELIKIN